MKQRGEKITMLTAYDFTMARLIDQADIDVILVGDSASNVMAGNETTLPITLEEMIYHARSVKRAAKHALVVADMPFGTYQVSTEDALRNATLMMKQSLADAVKLEGGQAEIVEVVRRLTSSGIPVCGHLGLTPQSVHQFGGYGLRAKQEAEAQRLISEAKALQEAGCFMLVLEKVPARLTATVCKELRIPVIGIGAGQADGQVLVGQDMLGMNQGFKPKFLRTYADLGATIIQAAKAYADDVRSGAYPNDDEAYD